MMRFEHMNAGRVLRPWGVAMAALVALSGCDTAQSECETLCRELVMTCDYAAYPTLDSCVQGCEYDQSRGADIQGETECIQDAACDPIQTVECARTFNPDESPA